MQPRAAALRILDRVLRQGLTMENAAQGGLKLEPADQGLALAIDKSPELELDVDDAHYFLSVLTLHATGNPRMRSWRERLFVWMAHNAADRTEVFHLPPERTVVMGANLGV